MNIYVSSTGTINLVFVDGAGAAVDPSAIALVIKDSQGATKATKAIGDLTHDSTGHYHYQHQTASADATGVWRIECTATISGLNDFSVITWNIIAPSSQWVSAGEVKQYAMTKWDALNYIPNPPTPFANEYEFDTFLDRFLIPRAQSHINRFCKRDFDVDFPGAIPPAIQDVAARAASNMIQYMASNKMGPLVHETMFQISIPVQAVLPKDLQDLLNPWIKRYPYTAATPYRTDKIADDWNDPTPDQ